jgi:hypothetical protein
MDTSVVNIFPMYTEYQTWSPASDREKLDESPVYTYECVSVVYGLIVWLFESQLSILLILT